MARVNDIFLFPSTSYLSVLDVSILWHFSDCILVVSACFPSTQAQRPWFEGLVRGWINRCWVDGWMDGYMERRMSG